MYKNLILVIILFSQMLYSDSYTLEDVGSNIYLTELQEDKKCKVLNLYEVNSGSTVKSLLSSQKNCSKETKKRFTEQKQKIMRYEVIPRKYKVSALPLHEYSHQDSKDIKIALNIESEPSPFSDELLFFLTLNGERIKLLLTIPKSIAQQKDFKYTTFYISKTNDYGDYMKPSTLYYMFIKFDKYLHTNVYNEQNFYEMVRPYNFTFYAKDDLIWLIDGINRFKKESIPLFINKINNEPLYRHNDWRLPTKRELLSLEEKNLWLFHGRSRARYTKLSIDQDTFGDFSENEYKEKLFLSSDRCNGNENYKKYYAVYYGLYRQKVYKCSGTHRCNRVDLDNDYGAKVYCVSPDDENITLRLVRDF